MTADQFRTLALGISGAVESSHMGHPDFRMSGKVFASLGYPDDGYAMVKLTPEQQQTLMKEEPMVFHPCAGAWGKQGSTSVVLSAGAVDVVSAALELAAKNVALKKKNGRPRPGGPLRS